MRIGIISNNSKLYSTQRLKSAARDRGHSVRILNTNNFSLDIKTSRPNLLYQGKVLKKFDAMIPRVVNTGFYATSVARQFEQVGTFCLNSSYATAIARDKLRTLQILSRHNVRIPDTACVFKRCDIEPALKRLGGAPVIIKLLEGTHGDGVILASTNQSASARIQAMHMRGHNVLIQRFIKESKGRDIRAFVIGDRVVAAMKRIARDGEFRSNVHLGARTESINLDPEYERIAVKATHIIGLRVAGVDLIESEQGIQVLEVNASPGLEGIEGATHIDVADAIIEYLENEIQFPDLDIRQRLSLGQGYSIVEIPVRADSPLAHKSVSATQLHHSEIQVLSISRDSITIPSPGPHELVLPGDTILCFGKQLALKAYVPVSHSKTLSKIKTLSDTQIEKARLKK